MQPTSFPEIWFRSTWPSH